jgi:hypothetical protein
MLQDSKANSGHGDHLSTVGERNPLKVLEVFASTPLVIVVLSIDPKHSLTGGLEKKGEWVKSIWHLTLSLIPEAEGCRLSWNTLFFAIANQSIESVKGRFQEILKSSRNFDLESRCVLHEAAGTPVDKLGQLDDMLGEVSSKGNFGSNLNFHHRLLDGALV